MRVAVKVTVNIAISESLRRQHTGNLTVSLTLTRTSGAAQIASHYSHGLVPCCQAYALYKAVEEGVSHMWTCSALQQHPRAMLICDEVRSRPVPSSTTLRIDLPSVNS